MSKRLLLVAVVFLVAGLTLGSWIASRRHTPPPPAAEAGTTYQPSDSQDSVQLELIKREAAQEGNMPPLQWASYRGLPAAVRLLLDSGYDVNGVSGFPANLHPDARIPSLFFATPHAEVAKVLVERGAYVDARDAVGKTPLFYAATIGNVEVVDVLLAAGADVSARSLSGRTALHCAAAEGYAQVVDRLLRAGADPYAKGGDYGWTPGQEALRRRQGAVLEELRSHGITVDRPL